ncbi:MAG: 1-(5-phosphoribosyl)-5-[(5-phosphoribosylamino)methylideneamino]imidazole-4-carboxamide isomerase, partial [Rhizobiales bacterium]|nr:1-(5-phosphoribosyl)-5-[(5-phosphoribosylamino)methylideneamino]imidazole-4-carboxamide isomerase [Hyphomicrobiales bacterium]
IRYGSCVRLIEGDFSRETVYDADPADAAKRWAEAGAEWAHVVDLDGSIAGQPVNLAAIERIRAAVNVRLQLGGGIRSMAHIESAFNSGIDRVVLGTSAVQNRALVEEAAQRWPGKIAVGLDARNGLLATRGWLDQSEIKAIDVARELRSAGVRDFIFTDISRDGTLRGPNLDALSELHQALGRGLIASGGVGSIGDIRALATTGVDGVIIGRALYDGRVSLSDALIAAQFDDSTIEARA